MSSSNVISLIVWMLLVISHGTQFRQEITDRVTYDINIGTTTTTITLTITEGLENRWYAMGFGQNDMQGAYVITYQPSIDALVERQLASSGRDAGDVISPNSWTLISTENIDNNKIVTISRDNTGNGLNFDENFREFPCIYATGPVDSFGNIQSHNSGTPSGVRIQGPCTGLITNDSNNNNNNTSHTPVGYQEWENDFDHNVYLDESESYRIYWTINLAEDFIEFGLECNSLGWIGFGVSPNGLMINSDVVVGWIKNDNKIHLKNYYITERREDGPQLMRDQSNVEFIEGWRDGNRIFLRFKRNIHPCTDNTVQIPTGTAQVIWAYNDEEPNGKSFIKHTNKGSKAINLLQGSTSEVPLPDEYYTFDMVHDNYLLPSDDTTYYCKLFEFPDLINVNHIIRIDSIITPGNEAIVHHMVVFTCPQSILDEESVGDSGICEGITDVTLGADIDYFGEHCTMGGKMFFAWAVGSSNYYFPEHVGYEFGGNSGNRFILLQIHYDNPELRDDVIDSSGLRLYYTPNLRENSAGLLQMGTVFHPIGLFIPPGIDSVTVIGICGSDCTDEVHAGIPQTGVTAFGNMLHSHTIGKSMKLRHIRGNKELAPIDINNAYDFNYQQTIILDEIKILPRDQLLLECVYDSSKRDFMTFGGERSSEEMCTTYLYVYPKPDNLNKCFSLWGNDQLTAFWTNAFLSGYATSSNTSDIKTYSYDVTVEGALQYYLNFWKPDYWVQDCEANFISIIPNDLEEYVAETYCTTECGTDLNSGPYGELTCNGDNSICCDGFKCQNDGQCVQHPSPKLANSNFGESYNNYYNIYLETVDSNNQLHLILWVLMLVIFILIITGLMVCCWSCYIQSNNGYDFHKNDFTDTS